MSGRSDGRGMAASLLVMAIVSGILVGGGLVPLRASAAEQQEQRSLAERLCGWRWWDNRETTELKQVLRDRSDRQVADEVARHAASGNAVAQCALGVLYSMGYGVPRDDRQAAVWYRKAAEQGDAKAQVNLGWLYHEGLGVPQDFVLAYMWMSLAASQISAFADFRDQIARKMTTQQIAEGQRLARAWKPGVSAPAGLETAPERPATSRGTGFVVSRQGHVLRANHVVAGCRTIQASLEGRTLPLTVVASDPTNDAAVLKLLEPLPHTARVRAGHSVQPGEGVAGIGNDTRLLQITAPVQPGNSGGPPLDQRGAVVWMVVSTLDAIKVVELAGDLP